MLKLVEEINDSTDPEGLCETSLDELCRMAAQDMLKQALLGERRSYLIAHSAERDENGNRLVVGNGFHKERQVVTGAGPLDIEAPRVDDKREGKKFSSSILPAYMRKSPKVTEVLPVLYLRGLSTGDFRPALGQFLGTEDGMSPSTIQRLTEAWQTEHAEWNLRDLSSEQFVYWWVDGVHFRVRLEEDDLCCLVVVGVAADGTKHLVTVQDGYREDTESWLDLLRDLKRRGLTPPLLAVGDGALGFWSALSEVFPGVAEQRCWIHKTKNVMAALPKRLHSEAKPLIHRIYKAPTREQAIIEAQNFAQHYEEFPKATVKITGDLDRLLAFYDFPKQHWIHLRSTNPIESTFSTVRLRTKKTRGAGSRKAAFAMAYKLLTSAEKRWRQINAVDEIPHLLNGVQYINGKPVNNQPQDNKIETKTTDLEGTVAA